MSADNTPLLLFGHDADYYMKLLDNGKLAEAGKLRPMSASEENALEEVVKALRRGTALSQYHREQCQKILARTEGLELPDNAENGKDEKEPPAGKTRPPTSKDVASRYLRVRYTRGGNRMA